MWVSEKSIRCAFSFRHENQDFFSIYDSFLLYKRSFCRTDKIYQTERPLSRKNVEALPLEPVAIPENVYLFMVRWVSLKNRSDNERFDANFRYMDVFIILMDIS